MLAPILLLLNQDPLLFRRLTDARRYLPPVLCASAYLTISTAVGVLGRFSAAADRSPFAAVGAPGSGPWAAAKNLALLLVALPNHIAFLRVNKPASRHD
jgi:hypothetical protein